MRKKLPFTVDFYAFIPACLFALFTVVGYAFQTDNSFAPLYRTTPNIMLAILSGIILTLGFYFVLKNLFCWFDAKRFASNSEPPSMREMLKRYFLFYSLVIFICWLPWIIVHYPGIMRDDSIRQMFQLYSIEPYSNGNPLLDTGIFGLFWHLGDALGNRALGLYIYGFTQALCTAASFAFMLCYMRKIQIPSVIIIISLGAISLINIFPLAAMSMSKDSLNGWIYIVFFVLFVELCRSKGEILKQRNFIVAVSVVTILAISTKRTTLYVVALAFGALILFTDAYRKRSFTVLASVILIAVLFSSIFLPAIMKNNAEPEKETSSISTAFFLIPMQQIGGLLASGQEILPEERKNLEQLIDSETAARVYNPQRADEIISTTKDEATEEDVNVYLSTWAKLGLQYPGIYMTALVNQLYGWFCPSWEIGFGKNLSLDVFDKGHMQLWGYYFPGGTEAAQSFLAPLDTDIDSFDTAQWLLGKWANVQDKIPLITSFGFWCVWLPLVGFAYSLRTRQRQALVAYTAWAALLLSCLIGPMVLYWYAIPLFYTAPLAFSLGLGKQMHSQQNQI